MANLQGAFAEGQYTPGSVEPTSFEDLPAGDYPVIIVDSEMKDTKDRMGQYLNLTLQIIGEQHKGRRIFDRLNLVNRNQVASNIAKQQLESICRAVNMTDPIRDSVQLHNKAFVVRLAYNEQARNGDRIPEGQRNEIKAYKPYQQQQHNAPVQQPAFQASAATGTASGMSPLNNAPPQYASNPPATAHNQDASRAPWMQ